MAIAPLISGLRRKGDDDMGSKVIDGDYTVETISSSETWENPRIKIIAKYTIVAGGGSAGGGDGSNWPAGGGGGEVLQGEDLDVTGQSTISAVVGNAGQDSSFGDLVATKGGDGYWQSHGGTSGNGNAGGVRTANNTGGGGGGNGGVGGHAAWTNGGAGGAGSTCAITGNIYGPGGPGYPNGTAPSGYQNPGSGGGQPSGLGEKPAKAGIIILRYLTKQYDGLFTFHG